MVLKARSRGLNNTERPQGNHRQEKGRSMLKLKQKLTIQFQNFPCWIRLVMKLNA
jgi:ABC-type histidine transport system ATPase subunit